MTSLKKAILFLSVTLFSATCFSQKYKNFRVAVYCRAYEVKQMADTAKYLKPIWDEISRQLSVDKVYLETHRDMLVVDQQTITIAKKFFHDRGIEVAGGITLTRSEPNRFETFCYSNAEDRKFVKGLVEFTAKNFDELILDDFFFTDCKSDESIKEKGTRSWTDYRLELMTEAAKNLIVGPAKAVNKNIKVVVKYPNWYEHFPGLGFNLETEPKIFDGIYTGTETRDAVNSAQHLQPYLSYNIIRYFSNIKPGGNGGGWVDPGGMKYYDRYAEQLWLTLFAKAPEQTLFDFRQLRMTLSDKYRAPWQGQKTSFDADEMMQPVSRNGSAPAMPTTIARVAGYSFEKIDKILGFLGAPVGIKNYRPYQSLGEDFLQNYFGMIGLPMDQQPVFPAEDSVIFLTEEAKYDKEIVEKIKTQLTQGKQVFITSGLLKSIQDKLDDIVELRYTDRKAFVKDYLAGFYRVAPARKSILIPQIAYFTNDSWEMVSAIDGDNGWPILHEADYSKGKLYVITVPDNFSDLYEYPDAVLNIIRQAMGSQMKIHMEGPPKISLMVYDNNTAVVESFQDTTTELKLVAISPYSTLTNLETNEKISGVSRPAQSGWWAPKSGKCFVFSVTLKPHSYKAFRFEN
ncbi:MAG TPA: hypothetical protein VGH64_15985 [Puia sp.]|jgi:hypothetical protein